MKLLLLNEFALIQKGLALIIDQEPKFSIVGKALNTDELLRLVRKKDTDIIIINLSLPSANINSICKRIYSSHPKIPILLLLDCSTNINIPEAIVNGVRGIIWKENSEEELVEAIKKVGSGGLFFENPENCRLNCRVSEKLKKNKEDKNIKQILSNREIEVLNLFADGLSYKEIANTLNISPRTVETHKNNIQSKLTISTTAELIRYAINNNLSF